MSLMFPALADGLFTTSATWEALHLAWCLKRFDSVVACSLLFQGWITVHGIYAHALHYLSICLLMDAWVPLSDCCE